jgi:hypothetical protein
MADQKITDLVQIVTISSDDVLPIVDISDNITKKIDITQIKAQSPVQSVAGKTGAVVLDASDIGAGTVDNTEFGYLNGVTSAIQTQLNAKVDENAAIVGATKTKITYDVKGLVTAGADATTADIADSTNKRYVTDANLTVIGNTSGTNTGDNAVNSLYSGLAASKQDTLTLTTTGTSGAATLVGATLNIPQYSGGGGSGTVTSVAALTLGTTGSDLSSTVANGTTTPVITLNVPSANVANRGVLTAADWINFNSKQAALVSGTNIKTINSTSILGSGNLVVSGVPSGVSGAIQFSNGSVFTSDATNFFWDDVNNRLGIGINTPSASLHVKGIGTTSGTTTIKIVNSSSEDLLRITDDGNLQAVGFRINPGNAAQGELVAGTSIDTYSPLGGARSMSFLASPGAPGTTRTQFGAYFNGGWYSQLDILNNQGGVTGDVYLMQSGLGNLGIKTNNPKAPVHIGGSPTANANFATLSLGTPAAFDGSTANKFAGNANGTFIATNRTSGSASHIDCQNNGVSVFEVTDSGVGTFNASVPDVSAQLQVDSTTKGFLMPRMTNAQRTAIVSPAEGLLVHNTTNKGTAYYDGTNWGYLNGAAQTIAGSGGTVNIPFASGNIVNLTLTASTTLTFSGHVVGVYILKVIQGGSGSYTLTYPASVKWSGGTAPTLTTTVGKTDIITLFHDGTNFFGTYSLNY